MSRASKEWRFHSGRNVRHSAWRRRWSCCIRTGRPLKTVDHGLAEHRREVRVLAVGLLAAAPARVAEDVDVRRPERQSLIAEMVSVAHDVVFRAGLVAHCVEDVVDERRVPCGGHADRLREYGGEPLASHAVESLVPPVVALDAETRDGGGVVHHHGYFLIDREFLEKGRGAFLR